MATPSGSEHSAVNDAAEPGTPAYALCEVERELHDEPGGFEFFQAVRLLTRIFAEREPVGRFVPPDREAVRFSVNPSVSFPPSQIQGIDWSAGIPRVIVNFMGLTGPLGALPYAYSDLIMERLRTKDRTLAEFFDIFNHRAISLFYQAWEKYRFPVSFERDGQDRVSNGLMSLIGIGTEGLQGRLAVSDQALLYYTGLLGLQPRSAVALRNLLEDYFDVPVEVEQFVGSWQELSPSDQCPPAAAAPPVFAANGGRANQTNAITTRKQMPSRWKISLKPICTACWEIIRSRATAPRCRSPMPSDVTVCWIVGS